MGIEYHIYCFKLANNILKAQRGNEITNSKSDKIIDLSKNDERQFLFNLYHDIDSEVKLNRILYDEFDRQYKFNNHIAGFPYQGFIFLQYNNDENDYYWTILDNINDQNEIMDNLLKNEFQKQQFQYLNK